MQAMGINDVLHFDYISPPSVPAMLHAIECLFSLGALDNTGALTPLGEQLALFPVEPQLAKLLIQSYEYGCGEEILSIVAMCSVDYPFITPRHGASSETKQRFQESIREFISQQGDHFTLLNIYLAYHQNGYNQSWCDSNCLNHKILASAKEMRKNLRLTLKHFMPPGGQITSCVEDVTTIKKCLLSAYFAHIAQLGHDGKYHLIKTQVTLSLHETSVYATYGKLPEWVLFNEIVQSKVPQMKLVSGIQPLWVVEIASHYYDLDNLSVRK